MQNHKMGRKNQLECEETGLFPPFLQMESLYKAKKIVYFLSNKKYKKTNNQYFACKKTEKHQSAKAVFQREKKKENF